MSVIKAKLLLGTEQNFSSRQDLSISRTQHQNDSSQSCMKANSEIKQLVDVFKQFIQITKNQATKQNDAFKLQQFQDMQPRDRPIVVMMPMQDTQLTKQSLEKYISSVCTVVWSKGFHYYSTNQLSFENTKVYCSQQILQNLIRLSQKYNLQPENFEQINNHLKKNVLDYMLNKYPMTFCQQINRNLNNCIREIDNTDNFANNFLYKSDVVFKYRDSGQYNDLIMRTINSAIIKIQQKVEGLRVYEKFEDKMTFLFESITDYQWMHHQSQGQLQQFDSLWTLNRTALQKKQTLDDNLLKNQYMKMKEKEKSSYQDKVKQYTQYKIGRKLPESTRIFTQDQINSHRLKIQSPQILRILTKWCQQLQRKFENTQHFQHFLTAFSLQKSTILTLLLGQMRPIISELIKQQKKKIEEELSQLAKNNYFMQSELLMRKLMSNDHSQIEKYQRISAQFSIDIVNNLHSYIIAYLNRLMHGLLTVLKKFLLLPISKEIEIPNNESIITFQIMDLVRCKCSSKQKQIIRLYNQILKQCEQNNNMQLVRVVNRLKKGTNDILINIKYRGVLCEIQLAVANKNNSFLEFSNSFNHYLYELKRSVFGPLTELCGIWKNLDSRFNIYTNLESGCKGYEKMTIHNQSCQQNTLVYYSKPFICNICSKHYFHNKYIKKHLKCKQCNYWICARCQIQRSDCTQLLKSAFHNEQFFKNCKKISLTKKIPNYGICIYIESQQIVIQPFRRYEKNKDSIKIIGIKSKKVYQIYDISSQKQIQKFLSKFIIYELDDDYGQRHIKISDDLVRQYLISQKIKHIYAKNKDVININNENLNNNEIQSLCRLGKQQQRNRIKKIDGIGNQLTTCEYMIKSYKNLQKLQLSKNKINNFNNIFELKKLQKLSLNNNDIKQFPIEICDIKQLRQLSLNENGIKIIPQYFKKCQKIMSIHIANNKINQISSFIFSFQNIIDINMNSNYIKQIPFTIGLAKILKNLSLQNNYIKYIPIQINNLIYLQRLNLSYNKIDYIPSISSLRSLKHLNLRHNNIQNVEQLFTKQLYIKQIDLSYNKISQIQKIDMLPKLKFLNLNHNNLIKFPTFTQSCINIKHILISNNQLSSMGSLQTLINLQQLQLNQNNIQQIHPSINKLQKLAILHLQNNKLKLLNNIHNQYLIKLLLKRNKIIQMKQVYMKNLQELDLSENNLINFDLNFLPKLKKINLNINQLQKLQLTTFQRISVVHAARNKLSSVPLFHQNNFIKILNLQHNEIQDIPKPMLMSNCIKTINLSHNKIKSIPKQVQFMYKSKQKSLVLQNNPFETLGFNIRFIKALENIRFQDRDNQMSQQSIIISETKPIGQK